MDVLPFYVFKKDVFGFQTGEPGSDKVVRWAVHTVVHDDSTFEDWLSGEARSKKDQR